jgi:ABC-type transport system substrate-binding protein
MKTHLQRLSGERPYPRRIPSLFVAVLAGLLSSLPVKGQSGDPRQEEVPLPSLGSWQASLLYASDAGIWGLATAQVFPEYGCPEVIALDDRGRCTVLVSYSGKWTPIQTVEDGKWLGTFSHLDLDGSRQGPEMYAGGLRGNLYQIWMHEQGGCDARVIAYFEGEEIHTLVGGDLLPSRPGGELLVFCRSGAVFDVRPRVNPGHDSASGSPFDAHRVGTLPGRVRDAVVLSSSDSGAPWIATTSRAQEVALVRMNGEGLDREVLLRQPMGFGRIARRRHEGQGPEVLYVSRDDGLILRLEGSAGAPWKEEVVYAGPQGPRGLAAGRFGTDPKSETIAVFGYSKRVQLLTRTAPGRWTKEDLFEDISGGHWLMAAELDGRNATDELVGSGYGSRVFMLARPPGYGLTQGTTDSAGPLASSDSPTVESLKPVRVTVRASRRGLEDINPLSYGGGFETKTLLYETLVRRDAEGRISPGLATWAAEDGGRRWRFTLRPGARWHDGSPVTADDVRIHFKRWVGLPEHGWLGMSSRIERVIAPDDRTLVLELDRPYDVLPELCAINPGGVRSPSTLDSQGRFVRPAGSGPWRLIGAGQTAGSLVYAPFPEDGRPRVELLRLDDDDPESAARALLEGRADIVVDGWSEHIPRGLVSRLAAHPDFVLDRGPGSSVWWLSFSLEGVTAQPGLRRALRDAISREALVGRVARGFGQPCATLAPKTVADWPAAQEAPATEEDRSLRPPPLRFAVPSGDAEQLALAGALAEQLRQAGYGIEVEALPGDALSGRLAAVAFDLRLERTWGIPYDPDISLRARCLPPPAEPTAASRRSFGTDPRIASWLTRARDMEVTAAEAYAGIQKILDADASIVPLFVPDRLALRRRGIEGLVLDHDIYRLDLSALRRVAR